MQSGDVVRDDEVVGFESARMSKYLIRPACRPKLCQRAVISNGDCWGLDLIRGRGWRAVVFLGWEYICTGWLSPVIK